MDLLIEVCKRVYNPTTPGTVHGGKVATVAQSLKEQDMRGKQLFATLKAKGWTITETARGMHCTDPKGAEFVYNGGQAVRYGTWHDVARCMDVKLPA